MNPTGNPDNNDRIITGGATSPDKVFGSSMPEIKIDDRLASEQIYGSQNYTNQNLQGHDIYNRNIFDAESLANKTVPLTTEEIDKMRRAQAANGGNSQQMYSTTPAMPSYAHVPDNPAAASPDDNLAYLNSISNTTANQPSKFNFSNKLFFIGAGAVIVVVLIVSIVAGLLNSGGPNFTSKTVVIGKSLANLNELLAYATSNERYNSSDLISITAEAKLVMTSHQQQLGTKFPLAVDKKGKETAAQADDSVKKSLEDAKAVGNLANVYRTELENDLVELQTALSNAYNATHKQDIKNALNKAYIDTSVLLERAKNAQSDSGGDLTN